MPVLRSSSLTRKRKHNLAPYSRKLRSKIPRRKRLPLFPIIADSTESVLFARKEQGFTAFPTVSCSSTCFSGDLSCTSGQLIPGSGNVTKKPRSSRQKKGALKGQGNEGNGGLGIEFPKASCSELVAQAGAGIFSDSVKVFQGKFRRRTRSSLKKETAERTAENEGNGTYGVSLSEISCLESLPEADTQNFCRPDKFSEMNSNTKSRQKILVKEGTIFSVTSCLDSFSPPKVRNFGNSGEFSQKNSKLKTGSSNQKDGDGDDASAIAASESSCFGSVQNLSGSNKLRAENFAVRCSESTTEGKHDQFNTDLTCSEQLSTSELEYCDGLESMLSELEAQSFPTPEEELAWICSDSSTPGLADCSPNPYLNSSGHLSETCGPVSVSSACFSLFLQYAKEFTRSNLELELEKSGIENEYSDDFRLLQFEDEEHEESYRKFRCRERRQAFLRDYVEQYSSTEYGDLVLDQRLLMINWIVEKKIKIDERGWSSYDHFNDDFRRETEKYRYRHVLSDNGNFIPVCPLKCSNIHESDQVNLHSSSNDLQMETVFLGVSLLDRFLCIGFFKNERRLQILGLACVTLATRIEENQPLNCIRQKIFQVGSNVYSRPEVVAMEWFVQEVLSFKCFMPTTFNFLWFYLKAAKADEEMEKCAHYLAVLSLVDHEILCFFPSTVAAGLVVLACLAGNKDAACQWILETHIRTKNDDLAECIERLDWMVKFMC